MLLFYNKREKRERSELKSIMTSTEVLRVSAANWSELKNDAIFFSLCAAFALLSSVSFIQLVRVELRVPEYGWTTQKVFHLLSFVANGVRAVVFGFHKRAFLLQPKALTLIVLDLPGLLFFSTFMLLVLFWAEIYNQARSLPTDKLRSFYMSVNSAIYFIQVHLVSLIVALGFLLYGGRLFIMLKRFPIESKGRTKKLHEVGFVTAMCFPCFLIRCFVDVLSAFDLDASLDILDHPIRNLIYYTLVEILPSAFVLFVLRKLPPKRISAQYQSNPALTRRH